MRRRHNHIVKRMARELAQVRRELRDHARRTEEKLHDRLEQLEQQLAEIKRQGAMASNVLYNLQQRGELTFSEHEKQTMKERVDGWDAAVRGRRATPPPAAPPTADRYVGVWHLN